MKFFLDTGNLDDIKRMLPLGIIGLSNSLCGPPCLFWNTATGATVGFAVAALAWSLTGKDHA